MLYGIERAYFNNMIAALCEANTVMLETEISEAVKASHVPFKGDTLGIDQRPENTIISELNEFDQYTVIITEERGEKVNPLVTTGLGAVHGARTFYVCDPCDRSSQLKQFLEQNAKNDQARVRTVLLHRQTKARWEKKYAKPASITGANAAITCVRRGMPICSAILNYITQEITVACSAGIYSAKIPRRGEATINFSYIRKHGVAVHFPQIERQHDKRVVTFIGKPERGYPQNFNQIRLAHENELAKHLHYDQPGGPTRILYLSTLHAPNPPIGFIVANGEKIGEWIHWLPFLRFAKRQDDLGASALRIFEVTQDQSQMRDGYVMTPSRTYSIFRSVDHGKVVIDVDALRRLDNPSKYRATLVATPASNKWTMSRVEQYGYPELTFPYEE